VGFCRVLRRALQEKRGTLDLAYSPENLRLGEAIQCYLNPGRIILGVPDSATERKCRDLLSQIKADILTMSFESAEMVKHGINSFLATSIVFANQLADICEGAGARIDDVILGMKTDPRIGPRAYLSPGIGFSGGTLGRDLKVLHQRNQEARGEAKIFRLIHTMNDERKNSIVRRIENILDGVEAKRIGILGLTYKPGTSTLRRSLPLEIVGLLEERRAKVRVFDPKADYGELPSPPRFTIVSGIKEAARSADALILLTEWNEFKTCDWKDVPGQMTQPVFFDTKNFLDENEMSGYGFDYHGVGRS
jgi:UDPglucose 6-dehydrogenase